MPIPHRHPSRIPSPPRRRAARLVAAAVALAAAGACGGDAATGPGPGPIDPPPRDTTPRDTTPVGPPTNLHRSDLATEGTVTETANGYTVVGALAMRTGDDTVTFADANLRVRFDDAGRVTAISGTATVPSPHPRIRFRDPIRAEVGFFRGAFLNAERDLGIRLLDDEDYFVYDVAVGVGMDIATGETGDEATRPISVKLPLNGRILMVVDYDDPMYYVYGEQDLLGAAGFGWSLNGRIPFRPQRSVAGLGAFEGKTVRTGTFPIFKVLSITGETVDNNYTELHLTTEDPFGGELRSGYQQGWNGAFDLDLSIRDMVGLTIPVADGSGGIFGEAGTASGLRGHVYGVGATTRDFSWWPAFIPMRPASELDVEAYVTHEARFRVGLAGQYGWQFPDGPQTMRGAAALSDGAFELQGAMVAAADTFAVEGRVTTDSTTVTVTMPGTVLDAVASRINDDVLPRIDSAQASWEALQQATGEYEFELSLRGVRTQLPGIADRARQSLDAAVKAELDPHRGKVYFGTLERQVNERTAPYYAALARLKTEAQRTTDNDATRRAIESALRDAAARKIFRTTITIKDPVFGATLYSRTIDRRIMSDANAATLLEAASHVPRITETSTRTIALQQVYDRVPDRELFEQVRDDLEDGLVVVRDLGTVGFVYPHAEGRRAYDAFVVIDGRRRQAGTVSGMTVAAWADAIWQAVLESLKVN